MVVNAPQELRGSLTVTQKTDYSDYYSKEHKNRARDAFFEKALLKAYEIKALDTEGFYRSYTDRGLANDILNEWEQYFNFKGK